MSMRSRFAVPTLAAVLAGVLAVMTVIGLRNEEQRAAIDRSPVLVSAVAPDLASPTLIPVSLRTVDFTPTGDGRWWVTVSAAEQWLLALAPGDAVPGWSGVAVDRVVLVADDGGARYLVILREF